MRSPAQHVAQGKPRWGTLIVLALVAQVLMVVVSVVFSPFLSLHALLIVATAVPLLGVGVVAQQRWGLRVPMGDATARHVGVALLMGVSLGVMGTGMAGLSVTVIEQLAGALGASEWFAEFVASREMMYESVLLLDRPALIPVVLLAVAVAPGFLEEYFFRGVLADLVAASPQWLRAVGIGVVFGVVHGDPVALLPLTLLGALLLLVRDRTGGWGVAAIVHFAFNANNAVLLPRLGDMGGDASESVVLMSALTLGGAAVSALLYTLLPRSVQVD